MQDPQLIWDFGEWIARREAGAARLAWQDGELILRIREGRVRSIGGIDTRELARRLECEAVGRSDLLAEAQAIARSAKIPETQAIGAAKEVMQSAIHTWLSDPHRRLEIVEGDPGAADGPGISITHAIVELILSDVEHDVARHVLPDDGVLMRRAPGFLELYAPLRLSEEADLVVSRISGERTAKEIASSSPHGSSEVLRLLAALVATGMLEAQPKPAAIGAEDGELMPSDLPDDVGMPVRRLPVAWIVAAVVVIAAALGIFGFMTRGGDGDEKTAVSVAAREGHHWALVVDMGCEPEEFQRILRKAQEHPKTLKPVQAEEIDGQPCWRLVWGTYPSREAAQEDIASLPSSARRDGFDPHPVEVPDDATAVTSEPAPE